MLRNSKQVMAGALFLVIGAIVFMGARNYRVGTAIKMGPGYFPELLAIVLMALGAAALVQALIVDRHDSLVALKLPPLFAVIGGLGLFGFLVGRAGLPAAVITLVVVSCYDRLRTKPLEVAIIAVVLAVFTSVLFIDLLKLPLRLY